MSDGSLLFSSNCKKKKKHRIRIGSRNSTNYFSSGCWGRANNITTNDKINTNDN